MRSSNVLRLAWRNLGRNRRRTALALAAIAGAQCIVLLYEGVMNGERDWLLESVTGPLVGHLQIHEPQWRDDRAIDRAIPNADALLGKLRSDPDVVSAEPRIYAPALAAVKQEGHAVMVMGVDPKLESARWGMLEGLSAAQLPSHGHAVVGKALAEVMGIQPGTQLAIVGQAADGSVANELVTISAVIKSPVDLVNRMGVLIALPDAQELFSLPGAVNEIAVRTKSLENSLATTRRLAADPALAGLEVMHWTALVPTMSDMISLLDAAAWFILGIFFLAAAAGVANTLLMSTFERTRELGMLLALGTRPLRLVRMVVAEAALLGTIGVAIGTVAGLALILLFARTGLDLTVFAPERESAQSISFAGLQWTMTFYPRAETADAIRSVVAVLFTAVIAALWPAARVARLHPTEAMRS